MLGINAATGRHGRVVAAAFLNKHLGVFTGLDALQGIAHSFAGLLVDDLRTSHVLTILRVVGDGVVHVGNTALVHQVNNQLQLVQTLEVRHFRLVTGIHECFEGRLYQLNGTTTENSLLTKQIGFSLILEGGFDDAGAAATDTAGVRERQVLGVAGSILEDGNQIRDTAATGKFGAHSVARRFRGNHDHIQIFARHDLVVVDRKTVGKRQSGALLQIRLDLCVIQLGLELVRRQNHNYIRCGNCCGNVTGFEAIGFRLGNGRRTWAQTNRYIHTGLFQVACMRVPL